MNQEYKNQKAQFYSDAQRYAKEWGITPEYYLSVQPYFFHFYEHVKDVPGLVKACYEFQGEGNLFSVKILQVADHPEATFELALKCTHV